MQHRKLVSLITFLVVFGSVAGISWALVNAHSRPASTDETPPDEPQVMPKLTIHEDIRDAVIAYVRENHPEAAQFMNDLAWTGGRQETGLLGSETYVYQSQGWTVTLKYPVVPNPAYEIAVDYSTASSQVSIPYRVTWQGTFQNGCVTEASYSFAQ
ncbi:MAG: hypothetical protein ACE14S_06125 [Candidatus Bathyarchaeia archaeon]